MKEKQKLGFVIQLINWQDYRKKYKDEEIEIQKDDKNVYGSIEYMISGIKNGRDGDAFGYELFDWDFKTSSLICSRCSDEEKIITSCGIPTPYRTEFYNTEMVRNGLIMNSFIKSYNQIIKLDKNKLLVLEI